MDIPDDIKVTARILASRLGRDLYPQMRDEVRKPIDFILFEQIAEAILAERDQCARVCEISRNLGEAMGSVAAATIRSGNRRA